MKPSDIRKFVQSYFEIDISKRTRKHEFVYPRYVYYRLCHEFLDDTTYEKIAREIGYDHATFMHGNATFLILYKQKFFSKYAEAFDKISETIRDFFKDQPEKEVKTLKEIEDEYRVRFIKMVEKSNQVIKALREKNEAFENNESFKNIINLPHTDILEFNQLADNFYKRKMKEMQFVS